MNTWYRLDLGSGADAFVPTRKIQETFIALQTAHGAPRPEWALFSRFDLHSDNMELYFTPAAHTLAIHFGAQPCDKPEHNKYRISLLCGEGSSLFFHFPDHPHNHG